MKEGLTETDSKTLTFDWSFHDARRNLQIAPSSDRGKGSRRRGVYRNIKLTKGRDEKRLILRTDLSKVNATKDSVTRTLTDY